MRYKWLNVEWPLSIAQLAARMKSMEFNSTQQHGFVIDKVRDDTLEARYIEKVNYTDTITDPFGNETSFDRMEYRQSAFRLTKAPPTLEFINSPRSLQAVLSRFSEITDFTVSIEELQVDVLVWAENLLKAVRGAGSLDSMQISRLELGNKVFAKVLVSGEEDIKDACDQLIGDRKYTLEKIRVRLHPPLKGTIVLSNGGSATLSFEEVSEHVASLLRGSLNAALSDGKPI
ncbi:hypothetical protein EJA72_11565 [Pseudomonas sp. PB120]|uniref:hypothetical protein n=1 Tax=Pseudomonas sp. PB120 TaxID=2494700 RepID=UPI0012FDFB34|nr:hypothetical protein [Pseudomonas sp. PB120]MVV48877.1 hypothetical protein [Pseudomonas sp. PB120]